VTHRRRAKPKREPKCRLEDRRVLCRTSCRYLRSVRALQFEEPVDEVLNRRPTLVPSSFVRVKRRSCPIPSRCLARVQSNINFETLFSSFVSEKTRHRFGRRIVVVVVHDQNASTTLARQFSSNFTIGSANRRTRVVEGDFLERFGGGASGRVQRRLVLSSEESQSDQERTTRAQCWPFVNCCRRVGHGRAHRERRNDGQFGDRKWKRIGATNESIEHGFEREQQRQWQRDGERRSNVVVGKEGADWPRPNRCEGAHVKY
jgi:hypothetical protein